MTAAELLQTLDSKGVELLIREDCLRYRAAPGAYTEELRALVAEHRGELLALLGGASSPSSHPPLHPTLLGETSSPSSHPPLPAAGPVAWTEAELALVAGDLERTLGEPAGSLVLVDPHRRQTPTLVPPPGATLFYQDERGFACGPGNCYRWTWSGASGWYHAALQPPPSPDNQP